MGNIVAVCISEKKGYSEAECRYLQVHRELGAGEAMHTQAAGTDRSVCYLMMK